MTRAISLFSIRKVDSCQPTPAEIRSGSIRDAVAQIKHNTFAALLLQCDPGEKLEMKAEETHDYTELQDLGVEIPPKDLWIAG